MLKLTVAVPATAVDWAHWAMAVPILLDRLRGIAFDPDGVAHLADGRREGLRLLAGQPGTTGSRYRLVTVSHRQDPVTGTLSEHLDPPTEIEVQLDDATELRGLLSTPDFRACISLMDPARPGELRFDADLPLPDYPSWLGDRIVGSGTLALDAARRPRLSIQGGIGRVAVVGLLEFSAAGPAERLVATLDLHPSGPLVAAGLLWPFVRGRVRREVESSLIDLAAAIAGALRPERTVEEAIETTWTDAMADVAVELS